MGYRNGESGHHIVRINKITEILLEQLMSKEEKYDLSWSQCAMITIASALHDIGKIGISEEILNKQGKLTEKEWDIIKTHPLIGASLLEQMEAFQNEELVQTAYEICRWHHERYDGKGYPDGLKGEEIPISAQVVSLADAYDSLVSERAYKSEISHEDAVKMLLNGECGVFNPFLIQCFMEVEKKIERELKGKEMCESNLDCRPRLFEFDEKIK